jgi:hypothetical protein
MRLVSEPSAADSSSASASEEFTFESIIRYSYDAAISYDAAHVGYDGAAIGEPPIGEPSAEPSLDGSDGADAIQAIVKELLDLLNEYLALDDTGHILFSLAVAVSVDRTGDPFWGMIVGAPSGGKTEAIRLCDNLAEFVDELTPASLLNYRTIGSGKSKKQIRSGILVRIGAQGFVTVGDFSTVLAMSDRKGRDQLFANLRRVYDGHLSRDLANTPEPLTWDGRCTILAGCTSAICRRSPRAGEDDQRTSGITISEVRVQLSS